MAKKTADKAEPPSASENKNAVAYRVLARKYRPQNFAELKGQDALVRTLTNAIASQRIAHAFMLTGVRGVGKTTTARIIARALNCENGPTITPCGVCAQCRAIAEDRNVDVIEMDAASNTSVEDIRDIIDNVQYATVAARYKVYIIDEVHMLSKAAFNALLKTLEEPPAHVKFVFATTEIRKVPVTILSRCQRFDLKRVGSDILIPYFGEILQKENVKAEPSAIALIARAADGSVRDGLSLLDQAIAREPAGLTEEQVRQMLGLVDRVLGFDLFESLMRGDTATALKHLDVLYSGGADPLMVLQDLLELTHTVTKIKISADSLRDQSLPEAERHRGAAMAEKLSMPVLARAWQMLLKGMPEIQHAPNAQQALEMVLIRLMFTADQPTPGDVLKQLKDGTVVSAGAASPAGLSAAPASSLPRASAASGTQSTGAMRNIAALPALPEMQSQTQLNTFEDAVALFGKKREALMQAALMHDVHLVKFAPGRIELRLKDSAPRNLVGVVTEKLHLWTGQRWVISLSNAGGMQTIAEQHGEARKAIEDDVRQAPAVAAIIRAFPGAQIISIEQPATTETEE